LLISSRNLEQAGDGFPRMELNGNGLAAILESLAKSVVIHSLFQQKLTPRVSLIAVQIAGAIFLACAGSDGQWPASPVAARITAVSLTRGFG
jgi:hypothetical protein